MSSVTENLVERVYADRGISNSRFNQDYVAWVYGNLYEEQGLFQCPDAMIRETNGEPPDEPVILVITPKQVAYGFSKTTGKIWKRSVAGSWSVVGTNPNGAHTGAHVFRNRIYFVGGNKLSYLDHFINGNPVYNTNTPSLNDTGVHPMASGNGFLHIGNGQYIARVDRNYNYAQNVFDTRDSHVITDLIHFGDDILHGTAQAGYGTNMLLQSANSNVVFHLYGEYGAIDFHTGSQSWPRKVLPRTKTYIAPYNKSVTDGMPVFAFDGRIISYYQLEEGDEFVLSQILQASGGEKSKCNSLASPTIRNMTARWDQFSPTYNTPDYHDAAGGLFLASFTDECTGESYVDRRHRDKFVEGFIEFSVKEFALGVQGVIPNDARIYYWTSLTQTDYDFYTNINNRGWYKYKSGRKPLTDAFKKAKEILGFHRKHSHSVFETRFNLKKIDNEHPTHLQSRIVIKPSKNGVRAKVGNETPKMRSFIEYSH